MKVGAPQAPQEVNPCSTWQSSDNQVRAPHSAPADAWSLQQQLSGQENTAPLKERHNRGAYAQLGFEPASQMG